MGKSNNNKMPHWVRNLRALMETQGYNPRSLSIKAGLNPTAVRDMLEGRSRFPRYDTAKALAEALDTTPSNLMSDASSSKTAAREGDAFADNLDLLTEIIARLQEVAEELDRKLEPRDFAAMAATIYNRMQLAETGKRRTPSIGLHIHDLLDYERLRKKRAVK